MSVVLPLALYSAGTRMSCTKDDLPEPDTPVMVTRPRRGKATVMPFRLFSRALVRMMLCTPPPGGEAATPLSPAAPGERVFRSTPLVRLPRPSPRPPASAGAGSTPPGGGSKTRCTREIRSRPNK